MDHHTDCSLLPALIAIEAALLEADGDIPPSPRFHVEEMRRRGRAGLAAAVRNSITPFLYLLDRS